MASKNETVRQVIVDFKKMIGMKNAKAKYALFAEDAASIVKRLTIANERDHWKIGAIMNILTGDNHDR